MQIDVRLLAGYVETEGVNLYGIDLGYATITSVDAVVSANVSGNLFRAENATLPRIRAKFDMGHSGGHGIWLAQSDVVVGNVDTPSGNPHGVINSGKSALYSIAMSRFTLLHADMKGAREYGGYINHASYGELFYVDFSGAGRRGGPSDELGQPFNGVHVRHSSRVNVSGINNFRLNPLVDSPNDLRVEFGGQVDVTNMYEGGTSQPRNLVTRDGIIFDGNAHFSPAIELFNGPIPAASSFVVTNIPFWVRKLDILLTAVSCDTASRYPLMQLSDDNGANWIATQYTNEARNIVGGADTFSVDAIVAMNVAVATARSWTISAAIEGIGGGEHPQATFVGEVDDNSVIMRYGQGFHRGPATRKNALRVIFNGSGRFGGGNATIRGLP